MSMGLTDEDRRRAAQIEAQLVAEEECAKAQGALGQLVAAGEQLVQLLAFVDDAHGFQYQNMLGALHDARAALSAQRTEDSPSEGATDRSRQEPNPRAETAEDERDEAVAEMARQIDLAMHQQKRAEQAEKERDEALDRAEAACRLMEATGQGGLKWRTRAETAESALARTRESLEKIDTWAKAYPLEVFPEPDFKKAAALLKAGGMTIDAISASNMRHVVEGVGKIAREALATCTCDDSDKPCPECTPED